MKKRYKAPETSVRNLEMEKIIAVSIDVKEEKMGGSFAEGRENLWNDWDEED